MSLRTRRPGAALPDILPARDRLNEALTDIDHWHGRASTAEQELKVRDEEYERMADDRDAVVVERDDLATRSLPFLLTPTWPLVPDQGAPIGDELAGKYGGWW